MNESLEGLFQGRDNSNLRENLRKARIAKTPEEYLSTYAPLAVLLGVLFGGFTFFLLWQLLGLFPLLQSLGISAGIAVGGGFGLYRFFLYFPVMIADGRVEKINAALPHATAFLLAMSKGGAGPIEIFRALAKREDEYGEIAKEAQAIIRNVDYFGNSPSEAIINVAQTTPSTKFKEFLEPLASVVETGADIGEFLEERAEMYYEEAEETQKKAFEELALYAEIYVIGLGLGPYLALIVWIPMSMLQPLPMFPLQIIVYMGIPFGSLLFILLVARISRSLPEKERKGTLDEIREGEEHTFSDYLELVKIKMKNVLTSPIETFTEKPTDILWITVPIAGVFGVSQLLIGKMDYTTIIVFSGIISTGPFAIFYEKRRRRVEKVMEAMPNFLRSISDAVTSGLSPPRAIKSLSPDRFGRLSSEIQEIKRDITWGSTTTEALSNMEERIRSGFLSRIVTVTERAAKATANIADVLDVLTGDVSMEITLKRERSNVSFTYVIIVYMIFFVFVFSGVGIIHGFLEAMPEAGQGGVPAGGGMGGGLGSLNRDMIRTLFRHAILLQGAFSGIVAGEFSTGDPLVGIKHSLIMVIIGWFVFTYPDLIMSIMPF